LRAFFDVVPIANNLVHLHGIVMTLWVIFFTMQVTLIRTKNVKLHITMGMIGVGLAILVFTVGMATAYDSLIVRRSAPPGIEPHQFYAVPFFDMILFAVFFSVAIFYRKRPAEHKSLMLLTAINFLSPAVARIPLTDQSVMDIVGFVAPILVALACLGWHTWRNGKLNKVFAIGTFIFVISIPFRIYLSQTAIWASFTNWLAS
jgi:hypothetical protein